jgi:hypothetical protein
VQSEANNCAGGLALKFSPRDTPCGGGGSSWAWARMSGSQHSDSTAATAAVQRQGEAIDRVRVRRIIFDNDDLHTGARGAREKRIRVFNP